MLEKGLTTCHNMIKQFRRSLLTSNYSSTLCLSCKYRACDDSQLCIYSRVFPEPIPLFIESHYVCSGCCECESGWGSEEAKIGCREYLEHWDVITDPYNILICIIWGKLQCWCSLNLTMVWPRIWYSNGLLGPKLLSPPSPAPGYIFCTVHFDFYIQMIGAFETYHLFELVGMPHDGSPGWLVPPF